MNAHRPHYHRKRSHHSSSDSYAKPARLKGPYEARIEQMASNGYANLRYLSEFMESENQHPAKCTIVQVSEDHKEFAKTNDTDPEFSRILDQFASTGSVPGETLFIVEDLSTAWIEFLGYHLNIDPHFFAVHLRNSEFEHRSNTSNASTLPSTRRLRHYTCLSFWEVILMQSKLQLARSNLAQLNVFRRMTPRHAPINENDYNTIGLVSRMVSFWWKSHEDKCWTGVLLVDPPLPRPLRLNIEVDKRVIPRDVDWTPYGGGYIEPSPWPDDFRSEPVYSNPSKRSSRKDVAFRWQQEFMSDGVDALRPWDRTSLIVERIALSHWMLVLAFLRRDFDMLRLNDLANSATLSERADKILAELTSSRQLCGKACSNCKRNLINLGINPTEGIYYSSWKEHPKERKDECDGDWVFLFRELQGFRTDTERLINTRMQTIKALDSKRKVEDSKEAQKENKGLNRLQVIGAIFGPVSFASGMLSMSDDFRLGGPKFWIFWITWIPLAILISAIFWWSSWKQTVKAHRSYLQLLETKNSD